MSHLVMFKGARLSFPKLIEPSAFVEGQPKKYSVDLILPKEHPSWTQFHDLVKNLLSETHKSNTNAAIAAFARDYKKRCWGEGNEKTKSTGGIFEGYEGQLYLSAKSTNRPQLIGVDSKRIAIQSDQHWVTEARKLYGGCMVNVVVKPWVQRTHGGGVRCELIAIQFAGDNTPFGAMEPDTTGMFDSTEGFAPPGAAPMPWEQ